MPTSGVARRYARAVLEIATEEHSVDRWSSDLQLIRSLLDDPALQAYFENPAVPTDQKIRAIDSSLMNVDPKARNFVYVLIENGRVAAIDEVVGAFTAEVDRLRGIVHAQIKTAVPMDEPESAEIVRGLERLTGRRVVVSSEVDPSILGGFVARIGDRLIDASVVGRLNALRNRLMA
jgi:F-type H+-transporting ATPase subunit delta